MTVDRQYRVQLAGLVVLTLAAVFVVGTLLFSLLSAGDRRQFDINLSRAQACALVGVLTVPQEERTQEAAQVIVNRCYFDAGVGAEAPDVPDEP